MNRFPGPPCYMDRLPEPEPPPVKPKPQSPPPSHLSFAPHMDRFLRERLESPGGLCDDYIWKSAGGWEIRVTLRYGTIRLGRQRVILPNTVPLLRVREGRDDMIRAILMDKIRDLHHFNTCADMMRHQLTKGKQ